LISYSPTLFSNLSVIYIEPKESAFKALNVLTQKSILFSLFSFFIIGIIAILSSRHLTGSILKLTSAAEEFGQGHLNVELKIDSRDEVGRLAKTFSKMAEDIKKLLIETQDKERMALELKTAQYVQSYLFPQQPEAKINKIQIHGQHLTSTECGGDWWHYFSIDQDLYIIIADATGHGTPAALITAASRSLFVEFEKSPRDLTSMASNWSQAVAQCSGQKIYMTAQLMKINTLTGHYEIINASHELPFKTNSVDGKFEICPLVPGPSLGEIKKITQQSWKVERGILGPGERFIFYTDGIWDVKTASGQKLSDRRFLSQLDKLKRQHSDQLGFINGLFDYIKKTQEDRAFIDDIAFVVVDHIKGGN
jgi:sigma-B regulation protein RsbU (phosphoserine phosphatase)